MCNRYRLTHSKSYLAERFQAEGESGEIEDRARYNIAPTQPVLTVRKENGKKSRHFTTMRWGLIPSWAKDMSIGTRTLLAGWPTGRLMAQDPEPSLRSANEFTEFHAQSACQSVSNLDSHADFTEFDGADVGPVNVRPLCKLLLR